MKVITREIGRCLTERRRVDFDEAAKQFHTFRLVPQDGGSSSFTLRTAELLNGYATYGVGPYEDVPDLIWLGEILDSSD
jgi:hypothetical protein